MSHISATFRPDDREAPYFLRLPAGEVYLTLAQAREIRDAIDEAMSEDPAVRRLPRGKR